MPPKARTAKKQTAKNPVEASPIKSVAEELDFLRKSFREVVKSYSQRIEAEIVEIKEAVLAEGQVDSLSPTRIHELRDMLTLMRTIQVKQEKGRRKDLKKIDSLVGDLRLFIDNW